MGLCSGSPGNKATQCTYFRPALLSGLEAAARSVSPEGQDAPVCRASDCPGRRATAGLLRVKLPAWPSHPRQLAAFTVTTWSTVPHPTAWLVPLPSPAEPLYPKSPLLLTAWHGQSPAWSCLELSRSWLHPAGLPLPRPHTAQAAPVSAQTRLPQTHFVHICSRLPGEHSGPCSSPPAWCQKPCVLTPRQCPTHS